MEKCKRSEVEGAVDFEGERVPFSGAGFFKLDFYTGGKYSGYAVENKFTEKKSYSVHFKYFQDQEVFARTQTGSRFFMRIDDGKNNPLVIVRQSEFKRLLDGLSGIEETI